MSQLPYQLAHVAGDMRQQKSRSNNITLTAEDEMNTLSNFMLRARTFRKQVEGFSALASACTSHSAQMGVSAASYSLERPRLSSIVFTPLQGDTVLLFVSTHTHSFPSFGCPLNEKGNE